MTLDFDNLMVIKLGCVAFLLGLIKLYNNYFPQFFSNPKSFSKIWDDVHELL